MRPKLVNPWLGEFKRFKDLMARTNYVHQTTETTTLLKHRIMQIQKARYLFVRMDLNGSEANQESILRKPMENALNGSLERCEVVVPEEKHLDLNLHKK